MSATRAGRDCSRTARAISPSRFAHSGVRRASRSSRSRSSRSASEEPGRLVRLYQTSVKEPDGKGFVTPVHLLAYRSRLSSVSALAGVNTYGESGADIGNGAGARRIRVLATTADYFDVVGVHPALGSASAHDDEPDAPVVVLSQRLW